MAGGDSAEGIFTQEQIDYVDSVKDEHLRDNLLHQVRLRDNMAKDRNSFEKRCRELEERVRILRREKRKGKR